MSNSLPTEAQKRPYTLSQVIVLLYQAIAIIVFVVVLIFANQWWKTPFIGSFVEHTMVFDGVGTPDWELYREVKQGDQLLSINGEKVTTPEEIQSILSAKNIGDKVSITYLSEGTQKETEITLISMNMSEQFRFFYFPYLLGFVYLSLGLWMSRVRLSDNSGQAFAFFTTAFAVGSATLFELDTSGNLTLLWFFSVALSGAGFLDLAFTFPNELGFIKKYPFIRLIGYAIALGLSLYALPSIGNFDAPTEYLARWELIYTFTGISIFIFMGILFYRGFANRSPIASQQIKMAWWGIFFSFTPIALWFLFSPTNFNPYILGTTIIFPIVTSYAILRYRLFKVDFVLSRAILLGALSILAALGYILALWGISLVVGTQVSPQNPFFMGIFIAFLAFLTRPLQDKMGVLIDKIQFRGQQTFQKELSSFGLTITNAKDLSDIIIPLRNAIASTLFPNLLHIYIHDVVSNQFRAMEYEGKATSDIRFTNNSPLIKIISKEDVPFYIDLGNLPSKLEGEAARLSLLNTSLFVPIKSINSLIGWIALGLRRSGDAYTSQELDYLEDLSNQAGIAIERAQVVENMEKQVEEMNALTRISQGVSITLSFNDVLELIFAQTTQIIPATDFHITLNNPAGSYFYLAFCIENYQRLEEKENIPLPFNQDISQWVARNARALITQDYQQECQRYNVVPSSQQVYSWLGVPLNAGSETIGALSVGSRDPNTTLTQKQLTILSAIANQTAGAIVKARLLEETDRRAKQLATLNQITQQLTSTLEHEPLLQNILDSAVQILDCEAGSLFMVDEDTDDLVFAVTVGPDSDDLIGKRLPAGQGIVGKAVTTRSPVVENNTSQATEWWNNTDQETGFSTRALLAVPLQVKEKVLGVVEVINKKDGLPFVDDDKNLLTAFAGQAAIAVENARLYTLTDQELNARVEELSIMQRIDRELNASLETNRAMGTTLEWAMRRSQMEAGLLGILEDDGLRIMAQEGYGTQLEIYKEKLLPIELSAMVKAVESGQAQVGMLNPIEHAGLLPNARTQAVVPLRREASIVGLILLESKEKADVDIDFLIRLSDHAAIAIANAQLYAEVEAANVAKSDFVSFVAHELKNPMTSIKGYTELLAAGAVGPVTDTQGNFLQTIRSNVIRMSTLVSDLNDNSKIEVGRLRMDFAPVQLSEVINNAVRSTDKQIAEKNQTVSLEIPETLPNVWADKTRVEQVLVNFVSNSYKYTQEGGHIIIGAEESDNKWDPEGAPKVVHVWVKDNGIGMKEEDQKKIFTKFFRSEDQKAREAPGTGLGLNITKSLIEMQGGRTWFESVFREGTTFHFTVPVAEK